MFERVKVSEIYDSMEALGSKDPTARKKAQITLAGIGKQAVPALLQSVHRPEAEVRRQIAAIFGEIKDPSTVPALIDMLEDSSYEVRWRAAESLIKMKRIALVPLLKELQRKERFGSVIFLDSAHHVLRILNEEGCLGPSTDVLAAFDGPQRDVTIPWACLRTLEKLDPSCVSGK